MQKPELELIIETIPDAVIISDRDGKIIYVNSAAEKIIGLNRSEIKTRTYNALAWKITTFEGKPFPEEELPFSQAMKTRRPIYGVVFAIEKPDGTRIMLSANAAPLLDRNGNIESVVGSFTDITEQKRAAEEISESRRQVLDILESITDAFYALDNDWRFTYVNHRAEELFGVRREQLLFRNIWEVIRKEQSPQIYENYHQAKEHIAPVVFDDYSPRLQKWLEMHVFPYQNGLSVYIKDVTDLKHAEEERLVKLHFFESMNRINRSILATNNLEQMMSDVLGSVLEIFDSDRAWLNYPCDPGTPVLQVPMERTKPEYPGALAMGVELKMSPDVADLMRILLNTTDPVGCGPGNEYQLLSDVSTRYNIRSMLVMAIYPKVGKPWMFGVHQCSYARIWTPDEKKLFQEIGWRLTDGLSSLLIYQELQESEQKYRRIVDTANEGIWVLGPDAKTILINDRLSAMLGYSNEEIIGKLMSNFMFEEDIPDHLVKMKNRHQGITETYERRFRRKDGQTVWAIVSATPVFEEEDYFNGSFSMLTDITERKEAEEALRYKNRHSQALLKLSKNLERAQTYGEIVDAALEEVRSIIGYQRLWVYLFTEDKKYADLITASGREFEIDVSRLTVTGDKMIEEIVAAPNYVVVEDAQTDERVNKEIVTKLKNRTIVNVPIVFLGRHLGSVGTGTFGDEGVHVPTESEREFLQALASHMAVSIDRIHSYMERKKAEEAVKDREQKYRRLIQKLPAAIVVHNKDGRIVDSNPLAQSLLGFSEEQLAGKALGDPAWKFLKEDGSIMPVDEYPVSLVLSSRRSLRDYIVGMARPSREGVVWALVNAEPELNDAGEITQVIVSFVDITDQKALKTNYISRVTCGKRGFSQDR